MTFNYLKHFINYGVIAYLGAGHTYAAESNRDYFALSLKELANIKLITSSRREQSKEDSYANITVITKEMISRRGYRNIIEMLEDLIVAATNEALRQVDEASGSAMSKLTGGFGGGMPGLF